MPPGIGYGKKKSQSSQDIIEKQQRIRSKLAMESEQFQQDIDVRTEALMKKNPKMSRAEARRQAGLGKR